MQSKYAMSIQANDLFSPLYHFWNVCQHSNSALCDELQTYLGRVTKQRFLEYKKDIMSTPKEDELKIATYYFIINRCSFSGSTLSGGFSLTSSVSRFTQSSIQRIRDLNLTTFTINNTDFKDCIRNRSKNEFLFLDPPYYLEHNSKLYGNKGDVHLNFNHEELRNELAHQSGWMMTYNNCDTIKEYYRQYIIIETAWSYSMNASKPSSEIIIISIKKD